MSFKLSALLNPASEPSSPKAQPSDASQAPVAPTSDASTFSPPTGTGGSSNAIYDAADALTGLAHGGPSPRNSVSKDSSSAFHPNNDQSAQSRGYPEARRASSYGSVAVPVEPSAVDAALQQHSPSLEQYHHRSKSPEEQRRQSLISMSSNPTILPPIHTLEGIPERRPSDQAQPLHANSYGHDASQIVSTSTVEPSNAEALSPNAVAQSREPDYVRAEPTTAQVRVPSPPNSSVDAAAIQAPVHSPTPQVKLEPTVTSREPTPAQAAAETEQGGRTLDVETLKAVASARNEHGLRGASREASTATASTAPAMDPTPAPSTVPKKRKPVDSKIKKKGSGPPKPSNKKRKVEEDPGRPSPTPSSKASKAKGNKKSQTGTPAAGSSPAPHSSPPPQTVDDDEDEESGSDDGIYCICRKGDNHTWMIACDGSCQDWYHGKCVNVLESDGDLIEKYFCPRCTDAGEGHTTWKRMCRREGCRRPARREEQSKYCSDECGVLFFKEVVNLSGAQSGANGSSAAQRNKRDRRRATHVDSMRDGEDTEDDGPSGPRGGTVSARDLKALTLSARDVDHFKNLGNSMLSPPTTASPSSPTFMQEAPLSSPDATRVADMEAEIRDLTKRVDLLKDRESFVTMAREQANRLAEREGVKPKDLCGYDSRLNWSEGEFGLWRSTPKGKSCLRQNDLEAEPEDQDRDDVEMADGGDKPLVNGNSATTDTDGDVNMSSQPDKADAVVVDGAASSRRQDLLPLVLAPPELCMKKRCQRHTQWGKIANYDVSFELSVAKEQIRELEADARDIRHRALVKWRKEQKSSGAAAAAADEGAGAAPIGGGEDVEKEGWVEVLG